VNSYDRRTRALAACLSAVAGFVDAVGYLKLHGFFVSFMSGNSTQLAVRSAQRDWEPALRAGSLVGLFLLGVMAGSLVAHLAKGHRRRWVLAFVAALLLGAAVLATASCDEAAIIAVTLAMGAENAVFEREGEVHIGLTYMTGTLVKFAQRLTAALLGGDRLGWLPYLVLWIGLVAGALAGASVYPLLGLQALYIPAAAAFLLALLLDAGLSHRSSLGKP
jgi:uncharacterized membrane protein YoaK (UPF0700 family)